MALISPGVEVTVVDESNYVPASTNSVPYILVATAQNKISGAGIGVARGTLASEAGKVFLITSQRDLAATFGVPFFYKTSDGTPINGYELNEYGLLAAYSVLGVSNRAYVQRANIDLSELTATLVRPTGSPNNDTYWLDTQETQWGIFQWNATTGAFTVQSVLPITSTSQLTGGIPSPSVGSIGDYAVVTTNSNNPIYYKTPGNIPAGVPANTWVLVGSNAWKSSWPTVQGTNSVTSSLGAGLIININGTDVSVPAVPNNTIDGLVDAINIAGIAGVTAIKDSSNRLNIYGNGVSESNASLGDGGLIDIDPALSAPGLLTTLGIVANTYFTPALKQSPNFDVPRWLSTDSEPRPTGSIWNMLTAVNFGANIVVKRYNATLGIFENVAVPIYESDASANAALDPSGGGRNIPANSLYAQYDTQPEETSISPPSNIYNNVATFRIFDRIRSGPTEVTGTVTSPTFIVGNTFTITASSAGSSQLFLPPITATLNGTTAADFVTAVSAAAVPNVSAAVTSDGAIRMVHSQGGVIVLTNGTGTPVTAAGFSTSTPGVRAGAGILTGGLILSNWEPLTYTASAVAPDQDPQSGRLWYYAATNQVDIMIQSGNAWSGYRTVSNDVRGYNLTQTDPNGVLISPTAPVQQSDSTPLVYGDLWLNTTNLEVYPELYRWQNVDGVDQWVQINNTDQTTSNGILFADARWAANGVTNPITDAIPSIPSLLNSNYTDLGTPSPSVYPAGMLLFNTRRSGFNVKRFEQNWFNPTRFDIPSYNNLTNYVIGDKVLYAGVVYVAIASGTGNLPTNTSFWSPLQTNAWVTASGNRNDGSPYMGRQSVRQLVVAAMRSAIDTQDTLREEQVQFNLLACPQYPELIPNMVRLNNERNNTGFVIGDTPLRLGPQGNDLVDFATNRNGLQSDAELGLVTSDPYVGVFYPSCQTTDLTGSLVVQPPSHMMLRTIVRSDEVAFPWLAPAGVRRGVVDNADRLGYIEAATGQFVTIATGQGVRDVLYENRINPITFIPGVGITNYGNKTTTSIGSALNRINVARLVAFLRGRLEEIGKTFVFEPNDQITRNEITNAITGLLNDLIAKRGIYDYLVVCDLSNNTPARIDRNELYVDIAIEPVKAVEFIYIPLRIKNTGEIASGQIASSSSV
jgi:hypothetical protein